MRPCSRNRKLLAWLAVDELDAEQAQTMRTHIEQCEGCRDYYESMARLYASQRATVEKGPETEPSFALHQEIMTRIRSGERSLAVGRRVSFSWLQAGLVAACLVLMVVLIVPLSRTATERSKAARQVKAQPIQRPLSTPKDFQPSIAGYRRNAGKSFENLDALLNKEGEKNPGHGESLDISSLLQ